MWEKLEKRRVPPPPPYIRFESQELFLIRSHSFFSRHPNTKACNRWEERVPRASHNKLELKIEQKRHLK